MPKNSLNQPDFSILWWSVYLKTVNQHLSFLFADSVRGKKDLWLPLLFGFDQLCLLSNQIAGFFDDQYLWKLSIDSLDFLQGNKHHCKKGSETTTFGWVLPVVPLVQTDRGFFDHQYLWKEPINTIDFCNGDSHQGKAGFETVSFG